MKYHYVWLIWASAFLVPWGALYAINPLVRTAMWRASAGTALFGLTEPIFVPAYWNPPSLFELAQRTRFDIESVVFSFAIGGIAAVLYNALSATQLVPVTAAERRKPLHRFHKIGLFAAPVVFVPLALLPWNVIYAAVVSLAVGSAAFVACRPHLARAALTGGVLFLGLYAVFMLGLTWFAPGYIPQVWNLSALSGVLIARIPMEELLFGAAFGLYWSSVYEYITWSRSVPRVRDAGAA